jgi:hypothetical protein
MKNFTKLLAAIRGIATQGRWFCAIALAAVIGFTMMGCSGGSSDPDPEPWGSWIDPTSAVTLTYSVDNNGVCKITVGGVAAHNDDRWKANVQYRYTAKANVRYAYKIEAWTETGTRNLGPQYYEDYINEIYLFGGAITLTDTPTTYTIYGRALPNGGVINFGFQCADKLGTFYVKILSIEEYQIGTLTITDFSGSPGLTVNEEVFGHAATNNLDLLFGFAPFNHYDYDYGYGYGSFGAVVSGASIILDVFIVNDGNGQFSFTPYKGNISIPAYMLHLSTAGYNSYRNKVPITFTNGNATINFGAHMEED